VFRKLLGLGPAPTDILVAANPKLPVTSLRLCKDLSLPAELLSMEERQVYFCPHYYYIGSKCMYDVHVLITYL
jgi:hypothetical protein